MTARRKNVRVWGVVPAAGLGRRMGCAKQTLPFADSTVAATVVRTLLASGLEGVVCVTRRELHEALRLPRDARVRVAFNDDPHGEMIESIRIGLAALGEQAATEEDGVLVAPADMPELTVGAVALCADAYRADPSRIVVAAFQDRRGHPIVYPFGLRHAVSDATDGLRELPRRFPDRIQIVTCHDACVTRDLDTPEDYERALRSPEQRGRR
jgi:molybdenum cofactor cytidylyltransferase